MSTGVIKKWTDKGFGFIRRDDGLPDLFVHIREVLGRPEKLQEGERVRFCEDVNDRNGKTQAVDVELLGP
jgi:cold shock CspA family protein